MSHLQYFSYPGWGVKTRESTHMNQSVRVGDFITISGQGIHPSQDSFGRRVHFTNNKGGWDPNTSQIHESHEDEVEQAFANVELALKDAGGLGWSQVFRINLFMTDINERTMAALKTAMEKWLPDHKPVVTGVGVAALAVPGMTVEVEVWAHDPDGPLREDRK